VTHTVEYPFPAEGDEVARDGVTILDGFDSTGRARKIQPFADKLNIPIGMQPVPGGAIVFSIPKIYRLGDTNGDDKADVRHVMFTGFDDRDTHGLQNSFRRWIDGWVYANHAYLNQSKIPTPDGNMLAMTSGNTYRFTIDGGKIEQLTYGQVNPFGLAFDPLGNRFTADCHSKPITMLLRGAHYPGFGKPHDGLGFAPEMINHGHGSTAIAGIAYYAADHFPEEYRGNLFIGNVVTRRVHRDKLIVHGSSYQAETQDDFITCDDPWFRPVDVRMGPDGALYIADFYNRIIGHYEVPLDHPGRDRHRGRIWQVIYKGTQGQAADPPRPMADLTQLSMAELAGQLDANNLLVRTLATNEIVDRFQQAAMGLITTMMQDDKTSAYQKTHGLWILHRLNALTYPLLTHLTSDSSRLVRTHLIQAVAERPIWGSMEEDLARHMLKDEDSFVQRAVVDAMSRHLNIAFIGPLLKCWTTAPAGDTHLVHMCKIALRNHLLAKGAYHEVASNKGLSDPQLARVAEVSLAVPNSSAALFLLNFLRTHDDDPVFVNTVLAHFARYGPRERLAELFVTMESYRQDFDAARQSALLRMVSSSLQARGEPLSEQQLAWAKQLTSSLLAARKPNQLVEGLQLAKQFNSVEAFDRIANLMMQSNQTTSVRAAAMDAATAIDGPRSLAMLRALLANSEESVELRTLAANLLAQHAHLEEARVALLKQLAQPAEPLKLPIAIGLASSPHGAPALLNALEEGRVPADLLQNSTIVVLLHGSGFTDVAEIDRRINSIKGVPIVSNKPNEPDDASVAVRPRNAPSTEMLQRVEKFVASYQNASTDAIRGKAVFTKNCAICHMVRGEGNKIGPQLDGIGQRGLHKILEDVLDPNLNVDPNFQMSLVMLDTGKVVIGLSRGSQDQELILVDSQGKELRVSEEEVDEISKLETSPMPANFIEVIPENDFYDLMAFLLSQNQKE
jgi:putative heme-binding domain-containing protein